DRPTLMELRESNVADRVRVEGDLPAEALGIDEVAAVASPSALLARFNRGSRGARRREHRVDLRRSGDVVREREGQRPAASDLADLFARARLGPQGKHELLADVDHQHVVAGEGGLPAKAVHVEPASPGE